MECVLIHAINFRILTKYMYQSSKCPNRNWAEKDKKLTKGIEELKLEKGRLNKEKEKLQDKFKEIGQKAFTVQEN